MGEPGGLLSMGHTELDMTEATQQQQQHVLHACMLSYVQLFATLWTVAHQAPLSMGILQARKLEWVPCPPPRDLPDPGIEPESPASPVLQVDSLCTETPGKPIHVLLVYSFKN